MSEKPQLDSDASAKSGVPAEPSEPNVSRETSEETPEQKMLNEIMDRTMPMSQAAPEEEAEQEDHVQEKAAPSEEQEASPSPPKKNKPSSTYIYLAVLFGAAFFMLLLAYFVQQRNNASVRDDLRITTASREELLAQIEELEEKRDWLQRAYDLQLERNDRVDEHNAAMQTQIDDLSKNLHRVTSRYENAFILDYLERFLRERDYLMACTIVVHHDGQFNRDATYVSASAWEYLTPANEKRYLELKEELFHKSGLLTLTQEGENISGHDPGPGWPNFAPDAFTQEEQDAALSLWSVIQNYAFYPDWAAQILADQYDSLQEWGDQNLFKPSTMELLEEIKEDLIAQDLLVEQDGALAAVNSPETLYGPGIQYDGDISGPSEPNIQAD